MLLPHSKSLIVSSIYLLPSQDSFTETITEHFSKINTNDTKIHVLGDFNINLFSNQKFTFHQTNAQSVSNKVKNYFQLFSLYVWLGTTNNISNSSNM